MLDYNFIEWFELHVRVFRSLHIFRNQIFEIKYILTLIFFHKQACNPSNNVTNIFVKALAEGPNRTT